MSILTVSALLGAPFTVPSAMAKAGVLAMTKSLAVEEEVSLVTFGGRASNF